MIVSVLLPRFALSVAAGGRAELARGPVALAPEPGREPLIGEASAAAEAHGVRAGLRLGEALVRCPTLKLVSPSRSPARTPCASAAAEASPISGSRPGSGASATGPRASSARPPAATERAKRGSRTQTIIEHMFASGGLANKG